MKIPPNVLAHYSKGEISPWKNVPDVTVDLGTACIRSGYATNRATVPSFKNRMDLKAAPCVCRGRLELRQRQTLQQSTVPI